MKIAKQGSNKNSGDEGDKFDKSYNKYYNSHETCAGYKPAGFSVSAVKG